MHRHLIPLIASLGLSVCCLFPSDRHALTRGFATERGSESGSPVVTETTQQDPYWTEAADAVTNGELERAKALLEGYLEHEQPTPEVLELLSIVARRQGDGATALAYAEDAVELAPERAAAYIVQTRALQMRLAEMSTFRAMMNIGDLKRSTARALELAPDSVQALLDRAHFFLYAPSIVGGDLGEVSKMVARLAPIDPVQSIALDAARLRKKDHLEKGIARCRAGLAEHPGGQAIHLILGRLLNETEDVAGAEAAFRAALEGPDLQAHHNASYKLAKLLIEGRRNYDEALALLHGFLEALPRTDLFNSAAAAQWWIGQAYEAQGKRLQARAAYAEAVRLDDDFEQARDFLKRLDRSS